LTSPRAVAIDTSVAVPLLIASHEAHSEVAAWADGKRLSLSGHALIETYAVLTRLPGDARVVPADAVRLIDENFAEPLVLTVRTFTEVHRELAQRGVTGAATYDGIVALAARGHAVGLATRDARARSTYASLGVEVEVVADISTSE
jgi:toxin FitB